MNELLECSLVHLVSLVEVDGLLDGSVMVEQTVWVLQRGSLWIFSRPPLASGQRARRVRPKENEPLARGI
jgi:hypothetical protein